MTRVRWILWAAVVAAWGLAVGAQEILQGAVAALRLVLREPVREKTDGRLRNRPALTQGRRQGRVRFGVGPV